MKRFLASVLSVVMFLVGVFAVADERTGAGQVKSIREIRKLDGQTRIEPPRGEAITVNLCWSAVNDGDLASLEGLRRLRALSLRGSAITDAGLKHLEGLTQLRELDLSCTKVTDDGLEHLKGLTNLRILALEYTRVAGAGLRCLQGLTQLQTLSDHIKIT